MSKLLSVSVPDELIGEAESLAHAQGKTKSEVVREALRSHLWRQRWQEATREIRAEAERRGIGPEEVEDLVDAARAEMRAERGSR